MFGGQRGRASGLSSESQPNPCGYPPRMDSALKNALARSRKLENRVALLSVGLVLSYVGLGFVGGRTFFPAQQDIATDSIAANATDQRPLSLVEDELGLKTLRINRIVIETSQGEEAMSIGFPSILDLGPSVQFRDGDQNLRCQLALDAEGQAALSMWVDGLPLATVSATNAFGGAVTLHGPNLAGGAGLSGLFGDGDGDGGGGGGALMLAVSSDKTADSRRASALGQFRPGAAVLQTMLETDTHMLKMLQPLGLLASAAADGSTLIIGDAFEQASPFAMLFSGETSGSGLGLFSGDSRPVFTAGSNGPSGEGFADVYTASGTPAVRLLGKHAITGNGSIEILNSDKTPAVTITRATSGRGIISKQE